MPEWYHGYLQQVKGTNVLKALSEQQKTVTLVLRKIPGNKQNFRYTKGKWTIKEVLQHLIDSERVFAYRALSFSRNDNSALPGFDENSWALNTNPAKRNWKEMVDEFVAVRTSTIFLFKSFSKKQLQLHGVANNNPVYAEGIGFIIAGHASHHIEIIKERYLLD
ncbi:MAG: DinB family protein [Chitinophagaceae bacterium]|nr:DinB family protein [Chitinophagaceae bacterium]